MIIKPGYQGIVFELPDDAIIADVGYGHDPIQHGTYYIDRDTGISPDRPDGRHAARVPRDKMIMADVERGIPLPDKSCDFVVASHILEHMNDPAAFCRELERIGKAGYIETPGLIVELINNRPEHKWYVTKWRNTLYVIRHTRIPYNIPKIFPVLVIMYLFRNTCLHWTGKIKVRVI